MLGLLNPWALVGMLAGGIVLMGIGGVGGYKIGEAKFEKLRAEYALEAQKALSDALAKEKENGRVALEEANKQAAVQTALAEEARANRNEVVKVVNVPVTKIIASNCVPVGILRVLSNAARDSSKRVSLPTGQRDDSCARVDWATVTGRLADDYARARSCQAELAGFQSWWNRVKPEATKEVSKGAK